MTGWRPWLTTALSTLTLPVGTAVYHVAAWLGPAHGRRGAELVPARDGGPGRAAALLVRRGRRRGLGGRGGRSGRGRRGVAVLARRGQLRRAVRRGHRRPERAR